LPLETLAYNGCNAINRATFDLDPQAEMIGWDIMALGLPHAGQVFQSGSLSQHLEVTGCWLERANMNAQDQRLLQSPLGLAGMRCMGVMFFASGSPMTRERREAILETVRAVLESSELAKTAGATSPNPQMIVVRTLSSVVEPAMQTLRQCWAQVRHTAWSMPSTPPRIWSM
jgi:urease accessory protein